MATKNYKSDFNFILHLYSVLTDSAGKEKERTELPWPDYDWSAKFWTSSKANAYYASCIGGVCTNCRNTDGKIQIVVDNHNMGLGILQVEFRAELPREIYPDGSERNVVPGMLDIELVRGAGDFPSDFEAQLQMPYIKLKYEDLTEEEKAEFQRPVTDATESLQKFQTTAEAAEVKREANEKQRVSAEQTRVAKETERQTKEATRQSQETKRVEAESDREEAETERVSAEEKRAEEFASWETEIDSKADRSELSNVLAEEPLTPDNFPGINTYTREELKMDLFIDMWDQAWNVNGTVYGKYDPVNAPDAEHPFMGNKLWLTYEKAMEIWRMSYHHCLPVVNIAVGSAKVYPPYAFGGSQNFCRTYLPVMLNANYAVQADYMFNYNSEVETILILDNGRAEATFSSSKSIFKGCQKLRKIISKLCFSHTNNSCDTAFYGCPNLEDVDIIFYIGVQSFDFAHSAKLSLDSLKKMVLQAGWLPSDSSHTLTSTITVHPNVYAKLTDETNTEWHQVLIDAAAKNITFATT